MTTLSTHVLDTAAGVPAASIGVRLEQAGVIVWQGQTDVDGRCPALRALALTSGAYRLVFDVAAYFRARGVELADPPFLDVVAIDFGLAGDGHTHVPLLVSPYAYSTYRGS